MSVFKKIMNQYYTEKLAEHGYVKVKGRYPYWAKMVGDEIVLIIAYASEMPDGTKPLEAFSLWGTVATVYRPKIDFDHSPKSQRDYMVDARRLYGNRVGDAYTMEEGSKRSVFHCYGANEKSVKEVCEKSYKVCEEEIVTRLDEINNLADVKEFYDIFLSNMIILYYLRDMRIYHKTSFCEALLWPILYSEEEYTNIQINDFNEYKDKITEKYIKNGHIKTGEEYIAEAKEHTKTRVDIFKNTKSNLTELMVLNRNNNYILLKEKGIMV